jgi:hypothetical protein
MLHGQQNINLKLSVCLTKYFVSIAKNKRMREMIAANLRIKRDMNNRCTLSGHSAELLNVKATGQEDNIKLGLQEVGLGIMEWIHLA